MNTQDMIDKDIECSPATLNTKEKLQDETTFSWADEPIDFHCEITRAEYQKTSGRLMMPPMVKSRTVHFNRRKRYYEENNKTLKKPKEDN